MINRYKPVITNLELKNVGDVNTIEANSFLKISNMLIKKYPNDFEMESFECLKYKNNAVYDFVVIEQNLVGVCFEVDTW